ncbi:MAG: V-type ATP synthase subunit F [Deltaproteobacteria bacterium]|jgi:V/A-type H+-transporting ATPase subunit F
MKIAVLTDPESAAGYRLGGLEVALAHDAAEAREVLARLVQTRDYALILVNLALLPDPYQAVKRELRGRDLPVLLPAPGHRDAVAVADEAAEEYMRELVRETMGYDIKL